MLIYKLFTLYVFVQTLFCGCAPDRWLAGFESARGEYLVKRVGRLPKELPETSGLALASDGSLWTHQDAGFDNQLFRINEQGELLETVRVSGSSNVDWEGLARDESGNLYIGDFGNNLNQRRNLRIFKVPEQKRAPVDTIAFSFADQTSFPPPKDRLNFDAEAFFWHDGNLYLFSKNRRVRAPVRVYVLPDKPGSYQVPPTDSLRLRAMITGADISADRRLVALLSYGKLYLFQNDGESGLFGGRRICLPIPRAGQAEAVVFLPNQEILFTNEGGKIFRVTRKGRSN